MHPAVAIVDTRNVRGAFERVLGHSFRPTVAGVKAALAMYGFEVQEVAMSVALGRPADVRGYVRNKSFQRAHIENMALARAIEAGGGRVLKGYLKPVGATQEEKQCDVLLALDILEQAVVASGPLTVILLSSDLDLAPALRAAQRRRARVFVAGEPGVVDWPTHVSGCGWLVLGDAALRAIAETPAGTVLGHRLRQAVAEVPQGQTAEWRILHPAVGRNGLLCQKIGSKALGLAPRETGRYGAKMKLAASDVDFGENRFPVVKLAVPGGAPPADTLTIATVRSRTSRQRISITMPDESIVTLEAPVGYLAPEARVLVHGVGTERRFVGATATPEFVRGVGHDNARAVHLATITAWTDGGTAGAELLSNGTAIQVAGLTQRTAKSGVRFACLYEGRNLVRAISSALP